MKSSKNLKVALLAGTALVAAGYAGVARADQEIAGSTAAPTNLSAISAEQLTNTTDDQAAADDAAYINANGGAVTGTNIVIDTNATVGVYDGTAGGETVAFSGNADINSGITLTIIGGGSIADGSGNDGAGASGFTLAGNVNAGTTSTRGGTITIVGAANEASGTHTFNFNGSTLMTAINVTGGAGGAAENGTAVVGNFGDAAGDTFNVTGITVTGGAGSGAAAKAGAAATSTITGTATIGSSGITVAGGAAQAGAGAGAAGAAGSLTFNQGVTLTGATAVTGGNDHALGANGGAANLTFNSTVSSSSTLTLTGGVGAGAGTAGDAIAILRGNSTFSAITLNTDEGVARLTTDVATDDTGDFTVTGAINGASAGEGIILVSDDDATHADTVTFANAIGATLAVNTINVGDGTGNEGGHAIFSSTTKATTINVGAADTGNEASTARFAGAINATNFKVTSGDNAAELATATVQDDITAAITLTDSAAAADATLIFDAATAGDTITVTGAITGGNAGDGIVQVGDAASATTVVLTGALGGTALEAFKVKNLSTATLDVAAGTTIKTTSTANTVVGIDVDSGGTLNLDAADGTIALSDTVGDIDFDGHVGITGDNAVTIVAASDLFLDGASTFDTELTAAATTTLTATAGNIDVGFDSDTTINAGSAIVLTTGAGDVRISDASDKTVTLNIRYATGGGFDPDATTVVDATGVTSSMDVDTSGTAAALRVTLDADTDELDSGDTITVIDTNDLEDEGGVDTTLTALIASGDVVLQDTGLVDLQDNGSAGDDLLVKAVFKSARSVLEDGSTGVGAAQALMDTSTATTTGNLQTARGNLLAAGDANAAQDVAESLAPDANRAVVESGQAFTGEVSRITSTRLASLRDGGETGVAAGEAGGSSWWLQGFGTIGNQDERDGVKGYDFHGYGVALGADTQNLTDGATLGLALAYARTDVNSDNSNDTDTNIDSYQVALYGDYDLDERTYIAGQAGYTWSSNETERHNVGAVSGVTASGDYDSNQFNVRAELGRRYMAEQTKLTPKLLADYTYYNADGYTETGAGTSNLNVDQDSLDILNLGVGVDAVWDVKHDNGTSCEPALHAAVKYDVLGDDIQTTNSFTGGGSAFKTNGADPAQLSLDLGADVVYHAASNWDLKAGYYFNGKEDYMSHSALLKAAYKF